MPTPPLQGAPGESSDVTPLPELQLTEIFKSPEPILPEVTGEDNLPAIAKPQAITLWGEYSMIIDETSNNIVLLDGEGEKVDDFVRISQLRQREGYQWDAILNHFGKLADQRRKASAGTYRYLLKPGRTGDQSDLTFDALSPSMQKSFNVEWHDGDEDYTNFETFSDKTLAVNFEDPLITQLEQGRFILILDKDGLFVAFDTAPKGNTLPPRNWVRYDYFSYDLPAPIFLFLENEEQSTLLEGTVELGSGFLANSTENSIGFGHAEARTSGGGYALIHREQIQNAQVCADPTNPNVCYFCRSEHPREMWRLDMNGEPTTWQSEAAPFRGQHGVENLRFDPHGNFFLFDSGEEIRVVDRHSLEEVGRFPGQDLIHFDNQGRIHTFDETGHLVILEPNLNEIAGVLESRRVASLVDNINVDDLFQRESGPKSGVAEVAQPNEIAYLEPTKLSFTTKFQAEIDGAANLDDLEIVSQALEALRVKLRGQSLRPVMIKFVVEDIEAAILEKKREFAEPEVKSLVGRIRSKLDGLTINTIQETEGDLTELDSFAPLVDPELRHEISEVKEAFRQQTVDFFKNESERIQEQIDELLGDVEKELEAIDNYHAFEEWEDYSFPQRMSRLGIVARGCPREAKEAHQIIQGAMMRLNELKTVYSKRFEEKYEQVREEAHAETSALETSIKQGIVGFIEKLSRKGFKTRTEATTFIEGHPLYEMVEGQIELLRDRNPEMAEEFENKLKVEVAIAVDEISRQGEVTVDGRGRQTIKIGNQTVYRFEGHVEKAEDKTTEEPKVDFIFVENEASKGPGMGGKEIMGDLAVRIELPNGKEKVVRLFEGNRKEADWRYGGVEIRGAEISETYLKQGDYRKIKKSLRKWGTAEQPGPLRQQFEQERGKIEAIFARRPKGSSGKKLREGPEFETWKEEATTAIEAYGEFCAENHITLLRRFDNLRQSPLSEIERAAKGTNGNGKVPEWSPHWTIDQQTELHLEKMAMHSNMQEELKEGLLCLRGHAGTGKDVLVKMFCRKTRRPYFAVDCSKWTTEYELSEDIILDSPDGTPKAVKVPSRVLNAIQTPGAVLYFNEFNAMPEQAQMFLHALLDEKRSLSMKTRSGEEVKAKSDVLIMASMNPGYPGTFDPQFATDSRMQPMDVDYPPVTRPASPDDSNRNPVLNSSEAMRIARGTASLKGLTHDPNCETNEFIQMWDHFVNRLDNGAEEFTAEQEFDVEVIMGLVQFAELLRQPFLAKFNERPSKADRKLMSDLPVDQPFTLREMRRCAWYLSRQITPEEKRSGTLDTDQVTKDLIEEYFLIHIKNPVDREKIKGMMRTWTHKKRPS